MFFNVYVQDKFYKIMEGKDVGEILVKVGRDIAENKVPDFDPTKNHDVKIEPQAG